MTMEAEYHVFGKTVPCTHRVDTGTEFVLSTRTIRHPYFGHKETYADALKVVDQDTVELREKITDPYLGTFNRWIQTYKDRDINKLPAFSRRLPGVTAKLIWIANSQNQRQP